MSPRPRGPRRAVVSVRIRPDLLEALEETADELTVSRNKLVEVAVEEYLWRLNLPTERPSPGPTGRVCACGLAACVCRDVPSTRG